MRPFIRLAAPGQLLGSCKSGMHYQTCEVRKLEFHLGEERKLNSFSLPSWQSETMVIVKGGDIIMI